MPCPNCARITNVAVAAAAEGLAGSRARSRQRAPRHRHCEVQDEIPAETADESVSAVTTLRRPTPTELLGEIWHVVQDLPVFLTAPLYRRWHLRWGATAAEAAAPLPGDALVPAAQYCSTRAITIAAPLSQVWPWLVQVGCLRAGFYSNDLLDNLARPSATTIIPALQHLGVGQLIPMSPSDTASERTAFKVHSFRVNQWLLWSKPDSTWPGL